MSKDCTIQDVFHRFYPSFESTHSISPAQRKAAYHIMNCKTGAFGVNVSVCEDCGCISVHYNSCRDRCCPMCQEFPKEKWVDARREDILDAPYFHVVFTVPEELNAIIYSNQKFLYTALYHAASDTLSELAADSKYLGTDIGYICILKVISKIFRGKYMAELKQLWKNDRLEFHGSAAPYKNYYTFKELLNTCYTKEWIPYCKKPFDGAESVIRYLGKYTHRIAISNYRIKDMTESTVIFSAKDYKNQGLWKEITISGEEFIRRFLMHVPPKRFVRIRHYGLLSSRNKKKKITLCRNILGCKKYISKLKDMDAPAIIRLLYNKDICKCSSCGGKIIPLPTEQHFIKPKPHMLC